MDHSHRRSSGAENRLRLRGILLAVAVILCGFPAQSARAQDSPPNTLHIVSIEDLILAVSESNQTLRALSSQAVALSEHVSTTGMLPDPTVMVGASPFPVHTARGEQVFQLRVEQMLPWPGKRRLAKEIAILQADVAFEAVGQERAERSLDAVHAALAVARAEALAAEERQFRARLERFENVALTRYETGQGDQQSIWKLQLAIASRDQRLLQLSEDRAAAIARIAQLVHRPVSIWEGAFVFSAPTIEGGSPHERAEYRRLQSMLAMSKAAEEAARLQDRPDWGFSATWMTITESDIPASSDGRDALALGVMARIPLGRSEQRAREEKARLEAAAVRARIEAFESGWEGQWTEQQTRLEGVIGRINHIDSRLLPVAESMLESAFQSYSSGTSGFLDLLDAERTAFELRLQRVELMTQANMIRWTLQRLAGNLDTPSQHDPTR
jgi:cobalt-zinc-cadmium efflux system outer membrane protein